MSRMADLSAAVGAARVASPLEELGGRRFLFVTGKGGVGKTTVSAALALSLAKQGRRVLVAMCHTKERLSAMLGTPPITDELVEVAPNVWAVNIEPERALIEYGEMILKVRALTTAVFDNRYTRSFFRAVPGLFEWAMLGKAWFHTTETTADGGHRFDVVLLDAPATGHGLDMLRVPKVILDVVPPGVLRRDAERAWNLFRDPSLSGVVVVTLPEELPVTETTELVQSIDELGLAVLGVLVNAVVEPLFDPAEREALLADETLLHPLAPVRAESEGAAAVVAAARRALRETVQERSIRRLLEAVRQPVALLPHLFDRASTPEGTHVLAARLGNAEIDGREAVA